MLSAQVEQPTLENVFLSLSLLPLGLIFVLGSALSGVFGGRDVGPTPVAYVIEAATPSCLRDQSLSSE